ncbi:DUF805 domain-containing protein [Myroides sp. JBRI-B21084]|uniref:DUF805 domain-containing protein n=1 Tax=Myroides sp. JBRI-B21084 TaxID=3119977 RepID=UPI0026E217B9|nr:DUF805 domain-containing protein [Paenimyroides cloacae]WKW46399.1 DUF805 domain-containing protein [Paenimyroides cloacae]
MIEWYKKVVFENYANFNGRARRAEYWNFVLCNFLIAMVFYLPIIFSILTISQGELSPLFYIFYGLFIVYNLVVLIPTLAVAVRRLHDIGKSGWFYFVGLIPIVGSIILLVWLFTDGERGSNLYGDDPKQIN